MNLNDIDTAKSYATEDNLLAALAKLHFAPELAMVVRNRAGRWTAVFHLRDYGAAPAHAGFKVFG